MSQDIKIEEAGYKEFHHLIPLDIEESRVCVLVYIPVQDDDKTRFDTGSTNGHGRGVYCQPTQIPKMGTFHGGEKRDSTIPDRSTAFSLFRNPTNNKTVFSKMRWGGRGRGARGRESSRFPSDPPIFIRRSLDVSWRIGIPFLFTKRDVQYST